MYDFIDRPVVTLDKGGRFLVWSMRSWLGAFNEGRCPAASIGPAFVKWGMAEALPHFAMAMALLARHAHQPISVAPLQCRRVREGEALILGLFHAMRDRQAEEVGETIALIVDAENAPSLLMALTGVALRLSDAGLIPEPPHVLAGEER